jgi:hypothetical protein
MHTRRQGGILVPNYALAAIRAGSALGLLAVVLCSGCAPMAAHHSCACCTDPVEPGCNCNSNCCEPPCCDQCGCAVGSSGVCENCCPNVCGNGMAAVEGCACSSCGTAWGCVEPIACWPIRKCVHYINFCAPEGYCGPPDMPGPGRFHPVPTRPVFSPRP